MLANFPRAASFAPLRKIARERNAIVAGFQHGVDRELAWAQNQYEVTYENVLTNVLFLYDRSAEIGGAPK